MQALLTAIMLWLAVNFDLPPSHDLPQVQMIPANKIQNLYYKGLAGDRRGEIAAAGNVAQSEARPKVLSVYNVASKTIYLPEDWTGRTPAELSVLVHETVHHLQNLSHASYGCPEARERLAYEAQDKWLGLYGRSLAGEFGIDQTTVVIMSACLE
jgi:hypothetical protein